MTGAIRLAMGAALAVLACVVQGAPSSEAPAEGGAGVRERAMQALEAGVDQAIGTLGLSAEQRAALRPLLLEQGREQGAVLERYEEALDGDGRRPALEHLQRMNKALRRNNTKLERRVARVLSTDQMVAFGRMQEGGRQRVREFVTSRRLERIGRELGLTDGQMAEAAPILVAHGEAQMALFDRHGVEIGSRDKPGFRTLLALQQETSTVNDRALRRLSAVFSSEQLDRYKAMLDEQRRKVRARIR